MAEVRNAVKPGSSRCYARCYDCQKQKKKCDPVDRVWSNGEKCNRCIKLRFRCGPNLTNKQHSSQSSSHNGDGQETAEAYLPHNQTSQTGFGKFGNASNYGLLNNGQATTAGFMENLHENSMQYNRTISEDFSMNGSSEGVPNANVRQLERIELRGMLQDLNTRIEAWLYYRSILQMPPDVNKDHWLLILDMVKFMQSNVYNEIKSYIDRIEASGDQADNDKDSYQAEVAYTRLIKPLQQLGDQRRLDTLVLKLAKFYKKNQDDVGAKEILRMLSMSSQVETASHEYAKTILVDSYTRMSQNISELYQGQDIPNARLNLETPCPAFHLAICDKMPEDVLLRLHSHHGREDILDICRRRSIHVAIDTDRQEMVPQLLQQVPTDINARDLFERNPLHIAVQRRCKDHTTLQNLHPNLCSGGSLCKSLVTAGADRSSRNRVGTTTLAMAARTGCPHMVKEILYCKHRGEATCVEALEEPLSYGQSTALQEAAAEGNDEVVGILLSAGAKASATRHDGKTADQLARERGHIDVATRCLEQALEERRESTIHDPFHDVFGPAHFLIPG